MKQLLRIGLLILACGIPAGCGGGETPESDLTDISRLENRLGIWYRKDTREPFDGTMVSHYQTGEKRFQAEYQDGLRHGITRVWYIGGEREREEHYEGGVLHGTWVRWYINGRKAAEGIYLNGKLDGIWKRWSESGDLLVTERYQNGTPIESIAPDSN